MASDKLTKEQQDQLDRAIKTPLGGPLPAGVFSASPEPTVTKASKAEATSGHADVPPQTDEE